MRDSPSGHPTERLIRRCDGFLHIPFRPVPVKARHDGWTATRQRGFIDRLVVTGCVAIAARAVGKTPQSAYRLRDHAGAASFRRAWDRAQEAGQSYQLDVGIERALNGIEVPVMRNGRLVSTRHRYDNRLTMTVLKTMDRRASRAPEGDQLGLFERYLALLERKEARETVMRSTEK